MVRMTGSGKRELRERRVKNNLLDFYYTFLSIKGVFLFKPHTIVCCLTRNTHLTDFVCVFVSVYLFKRHLVVPFDKRYTPSLFDLMSQKSLPI